MPRPIPFVLAAALALCACGDDPKVQCDPAAQTGCQGGQVCEAVRGAAPACFDPLVVTGRVFDLAANAAIGGARVVALDVNRAPASAVATTGSDGRYRLTVPRERAADGTPSAGAVTLRADAPRFQGFPGALRPALPVDTAGAAHADGAWTVASPLTDLGLLALPSGAGTAALRGRVAVPADHGGVLVVAETSSGGALRGFSAIADRSGAWAILNLAPGDYTVRAFARGWNYESKAVALAAGAAAEVDLAVAGAATGAVSGSVQVVNGGAGQATSVILVVASTFDEATVRGDAPPGLRAGEVTGAFTVAGVPDGAYVALAAFEDDFLVRDASNVGGTALSRVTVANGAASASPSFKVTGALDVVSPGATGPEAVASAAPTFTWTDDSSEQSYSVAVFDAFGVKVWDAVLPRVTGSAQATAVYGQTTAGTTTRLQAVPLRAGMYYQWRVVSWDAAGGGGNALAQTEDLKGVFLYQP